MHLIIVQPKGPGQLQLQDAGLSGGLGFEVREERCVFAFDLPAFDVAQQVPLVTAPHSSIRELRTSTQQACLVLSNADVKDGVHLSSPRPST